MATIWLHKVCIICWFSTYGKFVKCNQANFFRWSLWTRLLQHEVLSTICVCACATWTLTLCNFFCNTPLDTNRSLHDLDTSFKLYHKDFQDLDIVHFQGWYTISSYTWRAKTWEIEIPCILPCLPSTNTWVEEDRQGGHLWMVQRWHRNLGIHGYLVLDKLGIGQGGQPQ